MIDRADRFLEEWVKSVVGARPVVFDAPGKDTLGDGASLYLFELENAPPARSHERVPLQLALRYLLTTWSDDVHEAHGLLGRLVFAAMEESEPVIQEDEAGKLTLSFELQLDPVPSAVWRSLDIPPRPAVVLRALLSLERWPAATRYVQKPLIVHSSPLVSLHGRVVTELDDREWPVVGAEVLVPRWKLMTRTDRQGGFRIPGIPADSGGEDWHIVVRSKNRVHEVSFLATDGAMGDGGLLIHFPPMEV